MLDHAFGTDGMTHIDVGPDQLFATAVALQADGKIVFAGRVVSGTTPALVVGRLNPDGTLDNSLTLERFGEFSQFSGSAVAIDALGNIVVAGTDPIGNGSNQIFVVRLTPGGVRDFTFGTFGDVTYADTQDKGSLQGNALVIQKDGKIVVAGSDAFGGNTYFALVRLNTDGSVDNSFTFSNAGLLTGQSGLVLTNFPGTGTDIANSLAVEPDGTLVAAGEASASAASSAFAVAAYNPDGTPDADFNAVGRATTNFNGIDLASGVAVQSDGSIVAAGTAARFLGLPQFAVARFLPDGTLDPNFGSGGKVTTTFPNTVGGDQASSVALQSDGKILVAGTSSDSPQNGGQNFALARYNPDGTLDQTFSFDGLVNTDLFGGERNDSATALALQPDGKIVVVGDSVDLFGDPIIGVARYNGDSGQLQLSAPSVSVLESADSATLTVTRTAGATGTVTVDYTTSDGTATAASDYTKTSNTLTFQDGQTSQTITIPILDDMTLEGGSETFKVTLSNPTGGATLDGLTLATVTIKDPDMVVFPVTATEGQSFNGIVATFKGSNPSVGAGDYSASVAWGDNTTSAGTITPDPNGGFDVTGTHTYAEEGNYPVTISVGGADSISLNSQAQVADASLTATPIKLVVTGHKNFSGPVATFTDADPGGTASDYTATITWDDGTTSAGSVGGTGPFTVSGTHLFGAFSGTHHITIAIKDAGGSSISVTGDVKDPTPNELFVMQLYQDLLERDADPSGLATWSGLLEQGTTRSQVVLDIEESLEYRQDQVQALYAHYLYRQADAAGLSAFTQFLANGGTVEQAAAALIGSAEYYQNRGGGTASGFLDALYHDGLNRAIDPTGQAALSQALANGADRAQIAEVVFSSAEYRQDLVQTEYLAWLHRPVDNSGLAAFTSALANGMRDEVFVADLLGSDEFLARV
jgi:uncharacterized delta-60 repeat protein